jgi:uncharacterized membrane protein YeaQ/YmgE (transglycosylase-associated protein family)
VGILAWIGVGLIAGFVASRVVNQKGQGLAYDLVLGVAGALIGSYVFNVLGEPEIRGVNPYSVGVAAMGAIILLISYHMISGSHGQR